MALAFLSAERSKDPNKQVKSVCMQPDRAQGDCSETTAAQATTTTTTAAQAHHLLLPAFFVC